MTGEHGFFTAAEERIRRPDTPRTSFEPLGGELPPDRPWVEEHARAAEQVEVAEWLRHVFGTGVCPKCRHWFAVPETIAAGSDLELPAGALQPDNGAW